MKTITERSMFRPFRVFFRGSRSSLLQVCLSRGRCRGWQGRGKGPTDFHSDFLCIANRPIDFAPQRASSGPRHPTTPIARAVFGGHGEQRRAKTQACPVRRSISLASAYPVRVTGGSSGVEWSAIIFIASDNHIPHIYIRSL
jgi:hypothetical protein